MYNFKDMLYTGIWSKSTQELVFLSPHRFLEAPFCYRINDLAGQANYYDLKSNSNVILTSFPASVLKGTIDGLSDDDNPVIVELTLYDADEL